MHLPFSLLALLYELIYTRLAEYSIDVHILRLSDPMASVDRLLIETWYPRSLL